MIKLLDKANQLIKKMEECIANPIKPNESARIKVGVDLGTANIVITVLKDDDTPVIARIYPADVVRDGIVVDYIAAVEILRKLKQEIESLINVRLDTAATAIPPGIIPGNVRVIKNVVEGAGFAVSNVVDEPVAASRVLGIKDGAVVDIGGGTTGISVLRDGVAVYSADEPTGGRHMTLVIAGGLGVTYEEAEKIKLDKSKHDIVFPMARPVVEKMSSIILKHIQGFDVETIYLVGGTSCLDGIENIVESYTGKRVVKPYNPLLVTPIGIAIGA
ncbi:ethanolamine utilization protein EutJ [Calorimonas adulescens]|uniref:ethanolamine utilization protein EutJ n=1 Tax=Calorimonas adulescens TaxID=2606906 RepID=UPI003B8478A7